MLQSKTFDEKNFIAICDELTMRDKALKSIVATHGYPPLWKRNPSFETLLHIILEQQVSLSSARAALNKLKEKTGDITPEKILQLTDEEMRSCYFSRQKSGYVKHLAHAIIDGDLQLALLETASDGDVRTALKKIKGIGDWTADVYLMMALQRTDIFPLGDVALLTSMREVKKLRQDISKEEIAMMAAK